MTEMGVDNMRDGDVYRWRFKQAKSLNKFSPYTAYHCKSQLAVVRNGKLLDTFWSDDASKYRVKPDEAELTFLGNCDDMTEIRADFIPYYDETDIVDMRHSNDPRAKIYLKPGATKSASAMLSYAISRKKTAEREMHYAIDQIARYDKAIEQIKAGDLDQVYL